MAEIQRRGDVEKCPACGWRLDPGAYRCPKCRIYFCYKCRARVAEREQQYQCADQSCPCYGKLLCAACVVSPPEKMRNADKSASALLAGVIVGGATFFAAPIAVAAGVGVGAVVLASLGFRALGFNVWGTGDTHDVFIHLCCVECRHPVKHLR